MLDIVLLDAIKLFVAPIITSFPLKMLTRSVLDALKTLKAVISIKFEESKLTYELDMSMTPFAEDNVKELAP